jgi:hypothetical protein
MFGSFTKIFAGEVVLALAVLMKHCEWEVHIPISLIEEGV